VHELLAFDYAIVRIVPRVERGEFLNAGVIVFCPTQGFLESRLELDRARLAALAPSIDYTEVQNYLHVISRVCKGGATAGPIGELPQRARFHWLVAPRSTIIQTSPVHSGLCHDLTEALNDLFDKMVRPPIAPET
jgi:hypothetical protein